MLNTTSLSTHSIMKEYAFSFSADLSLISFLVAQTKSIFCLTILVGYQIYQKRLSESGEILSEQYHLIISMCAFLMHVLFPPIGGTVSLAEHVNGP